MKDLKVKIDGELVTEDWVSEMAESHISLEKEDKKEKKKEKKEKTVEEAFTDKKSVHIHAELVAKALDLAKKYEIRTIALENDDEIIAYLQDETTFAYSILNRNALEKRIRKLLVAEGHYVKDVSISEMATAIENTAYQKILKYNDLKDNILFNNGFMKYEDGKYRFVKVAPNRLKYTENLRRIDLDYKEDLYKEDCPIVTKFFKDIMDNDPQLVSFLLHALATPFFPRTKYEKAFVFYGGTGANGKTVLAKLMENIYAKRNISHVELGEMKDYNLALMEKGMVNWVQDLEKYNDWPNFKKIVTGESIVVNVKYSDPVEKEISTQIFINSNILPKLGSRRDGGYLRRLEFIPFNKTFSGKEKDAQIIEKLCKKENLEWLLSLLMHIVKEMEDDYAGSWFTENRPDAVQALYEEQKEQDSTALAFAAWLRNEEVVKLLGNKLMYQPEVSEDMFHLEVEVGQKHRNYGLVVYRSKMYEMYSSYCYQNGIKKQMIKQDFEKHLEEAKFIELRKDLRISQSKGIYRLLDWQMGGQDE